MIRVTDCIAVAPCRLYAFDVHCNSYFPLFLMLYGEQYSRIMQWACVLKAEVKMHAPA